MSTVNWEQSVQWLSEHPDLNPTGLVPLLRLRILVSVSVSAASDVSLLLRTELWRKHAAE